jgi:hypothetical protein
MTSSLHEKLVCPFCGGDFFDKIKMPIWEKCSTCNIYFYKYIVEGEKLLCLRLEDAAFLFGIDGYGSEIQNFYIWAKDTIEPIFDIGFCEKNPIVIYEEQLLGSFLTAEAFRSYGWRIVRLIAFQ